MIINISNNFLIINCNSKNNVIYLLILYIDIDMLYIIITINII